MNWWLHNVLADMPGPQFLLFFGALIVATIFVAATIVRSSDPTRGLDPPPIPKKPDAVEIAYLRGGTNEVTRLVVFDLIRRGYLKTTGEGMSSRIERNDTRPREPLMDPLDRNVFDYFATRRDAKDLFRPGGLAKHIEDWCEPVRWNLYEAEMLSAAERYRLALVTGLCGALLILTIGGYKLCIALAKGHTNVGFLILMAVLGLMILAVACCVPRTTWRGRAYLRQLTTAFEGLKLTADEPVATGADSALLLLPALFGIGALSSTSYGPIRDLFRKAAAGSGGGGCGAAWTTGAGCGCGGGGGGGGGCGGGGCGGGGCGGCGGG